MSTPTPDFVVAYRDLMLNGFGREAEITKRVIGAIPESKRDYRPDPHARTAWELAWHLANTDVQFLDAIADQKFAVDPSPRPDKPTNIAELVAWYDRHVKRGIERVRALPPEQLSTPVDFLGIFNMPAAFYLQFLNNHAIHHRGELATYLRPMGSKVPQIYGGSFDEPFQPPARNSAA